MAAKQVKDSFRSRERGSSDQFGSPDPPLWLGAPVIGSVWGRYVSEQYIDAKGKTRNTHEASPFDHLTRSTV